MITQDDIQAYSDRRKELLNNKAFKSECGKCNGAGVVIKKRGGAKNNIFRKCSICRGSGEITKKEFGAKTIALSELFYKGYTRSDLRHMLIKTFRLNPATAEMDVSRAFHYIENEHSTNKKDVLSIHYRRYERIFRKYAELDIELVPKHLRGLRMFEALSIMIETLQSKERAFGMHAQNFSLKINQFNIAQKKVATRNKYDFKKLSLEELVEIKTLIDVAKKRTQASMVVDSDVAADMEFEKMTSAKRRKEEVEYDHPIQKVKTKKHRKEKEFQHVPMKTADDIKKKINESLKNSIIVSMNKKKNG